MHYLIRFAAVPVVEECLQFAPQSSLLIDCGVGDRQLCVTFIIIIIIRNLYSAIMPLGGYRGAGGTGR